ncbi:MAG: hypothetical protein ACRDI1_11650 [Actinomycetota bacterium]
MSSRAGLFVGLLIATVVVLVLGVVALFSQRGDDRAAPSVTPTVDEIPTSPAPQQTETPAVSPGASPTGPAATGPAVSPTGPAATPPGTGVSPAPSPTTALTGPPAAAGWLGLVPLAGAFGLGLYLRKVTRG